MISIPYSLSNENESYLVIPVMRKFCFDNKLKQHNTREELLEEILAFASKNNENKVKFLNWFDNCLREGIKHFYMRSFYTDDRLISVLRNLDDCTGYLETCFSNCPNTFIPLSTHEHDLKLISCKVLLDEDNLVNRIIFNFTILLLTGDDEVNNGERIIYPIFVDLDLKNNIILGRAKPKSKLYSITNQATDVLLYNDKTDTKNLILKAMDLICEKLDLKYFDANRCNTTYKSVIYKILKEYTFTPEEIQNKINSVSDKLDNFINDLFAELDIPLLNNYNNAKEDLNIFVEKYISINYEDQSIFTKDREAYPVKLSATDSEYTKVSECSMDREPLQHKEKFFDNKKSIERDETCDAITLCFKRKNPKYFGNIPYFVSLEAKGGFMCIRFPKYVEEEDIQHVLSRIIENIE